MMVGNYSLVRYDYHTESWIVQIYLSPLIIMYLTQINVLLLLLVILLLFNILSDRCCYNSMTVNNRIFKDLTSAFVKIKLSRMKSGGWSLLFFIVLPIPIVSLTVDLRNFHEAALRTNYEVNDNTHDGIN